MGTRAVTEGWLESGHGEDIWIMAEIYLLSATHTQIECYLGADQAGPLVPDVLQ